MAASNASKTCSFLRTIQHNLHGCSTRTITNSKSLDAAAAAAAAVRVDSVSDSNVARAEKTLSLSDIDGPKGFPLIGNLPTYLRKKNKAKVHEVKAEYHNQYGPLFKERWGGPDYQLHIRDPDAIEQVMRSSQKYPDRPPFPSWRLYRKITGLPSGLVTAEKDEWLRIRKNLSNRMLQPRQVSYYATELNNITDDLIQHIRRTRDALGDEGLANSLPNEMYRWSMECIGNIVFDTRMGCLQPCIPDRVQQFIDAIETMMSSSLDTVLLTDYLQKYNLAPWRKQKEAWDKIFEIGSLYIAEKLDDIKRVEAKRQQNSDLDSATGAEPERSDLLTFMLANKNLSLDDVYVNVAEILLSGIDTTSNSLCFSLYLLAKHPDVQQRLADEVQSVVGKHQPSYEHFEKMPYLRAVLKESLRMFPVVSMHVRVLEQDLRISGYNIPQGTLCVMNNFATCRSDEYFDRANEFLPQRWLREENYGGLKHHPFASLPFGYGIRSCIGKRIAYLELQLALTKISQQFWLVPRKGEINTRWRTVLTPGHTVPIRFMDR